MKFALALALALAGSSACAQPSGGSPAGVSVALARMFGDIKAFTAMANVRVLDKTKTETINTPMSFALLDEKIRVDFDFTTIAKMPAETAKQLKDMGMEKVSAIIRPDKKEIYLVVHALESWVAMPLPADEIQAIDKPPKVTKSGLGKETIDGHPCVKTKLTMTDDKKQQRDALTWNASDMNDFPVQIQTIEKGDTQIMRFSQVQFVKPEEKQFEPPAAYTRYSDTTSMMASAALKLFGGAAGK